ncbi:MIP/aquaporin family protein [Gelatiniphilus marinus]|uniref:MIP/aquaporin family protein n=1 Tax=Gelatiniphilus marinus TaxID=1759464 RepID=A0ABW5JWQ8_9FLAO
MKNKDLKNYIAEFIGTFALVFCGTGAVIVDQQTNGSLGLLGVSLSFGIIITAMVYVFGNISGAHINPAITIGLAFGNLISKKTLLFYVAFQVLGAITASILLKLIFNESLFLGATIPSGTIIQSFIIEFVLTFFLMLTILGITTQKDKEVSSLSGLVIGAVVVGFILFSGPISGGSFNPARSIAPALVSGNLTMLWIFLTAPTIGAIAAMLVWKVLKQK